jgi:hypothetical protein
MRVKDIIAHIFDHHIMEKKNWTLDQLVEWVKTVEPADEFVPSSFRPAVANDLYRNDAISSEQERQLWDQEAEDWQAVCQAFTAKHNTGRRSARRARTGSW